jgi:DNA polymerase III alpha subunit (gram-positive type)
MLDASDWVLLDTKTTGRDDAEIVEIAILAPDGEILLDTLVRPSAPIPPDATAMHGIDDARVASAPTWLEVYPQYVEAVRLKRILAYNAGFDAGVIFHMCALHALAGTANRWFDVMDPYAAWVGEWNDHEASYQWQPLPGGGQRALEDCRAALDLLRLMARQEETITADVVDDPEHE